MQLSETALAQPRAVGARGRARRADRGAARPPGRDWRLAGRRLAAGVCRGRAEITVGLSGPQSAVHVSESGDDGGLRSITGLTAAHQQASVPASGLVTSERMMAVTRRRRCSAGPRAGWGAAEPGCRCDGGEAARRLRGAAGRPRGPGIICHAAPPAASWPYTAPPAASWPYTMSALARPTCTSHDVTALEPSYVQKAMIPLR